MDTNPIPTPAAAIPVSVAGIPGESASPPFSAIPSGSFSVHMVNAVLGMFLESAASIEEIANENNLSIPVVLQCLDEQKAFLLGMLGTLELRVRLLASRAEAVAIEALREVTVFARDQETRRKAASKLLSHFKRTPGARPGHHAPAHSRAAAEVDGASAPSPRPAGRSVARAACDDEGSSIRASTTHHDSASSPPAHALNSEPGA